MIHEEPSPLLPSLPEQVLMKVVRFKTADFDRQLFHDHGVELPDALRQAAPKRQAEYLAGRVAAQYLFRRIGQADFALHTGPHRYPLWPHDWTGSISHSGELAICLLAPTDAFQGCGVDVEGVAHSGRLRVLERRVLDEGETEALCASLDLDRCQALTVGFSAKESLFKALYPIVGFYFGFAHARLQAVDHSSKRLRFALSPKLHEYTGLKGMTVHYQLWPRHALTYALVESTNRLKTCL